MVTQVGFVELIAETMGKPVTLRHFDPTLLKAFDKTGPYFGRTSSTIATRCTPPASCARSWVSDIGYVASGLRQTWEWYRAQAGTWSTARHDVRGRAPRQARASEGPSPHPRPSSGGGRQTARLIRLPRRGLELTISSSSPRACSSSKNADRRGNHISVQVSGARVPSNPRHHGRWPYRRPAVPPAARIAAGRGRSSAARLIRFCNPSWPGPVPAIPIHGLSRASLGGNNLPFGFFNDLLRNGAGQIPLVRLCPWNASRASGGAGHHGVWSRRARGAAAARQGLTFLQSLAMNFFVCSGIAQLVALEIWPAVMTWAAVLTVAVLAGVVGRAFS